MAPFPSSRSQIQPLDQVSPPPPSRESWLSGRRREKPRPPRLQSNPAADAHAPSAQIHRVSLRAVDILHRMAVPLNLNDRDSFVKSAATSLNSKVVSQYSSLLAPLAVDAVPSIVDPAHPDLVDLRDVKIVTKLGGTVDDTELVRGHVFDKKVFPEPLLRPLPGMVRHPPPALHQRLRPQLCFSKIRAMAILITVSDSGYVVQTLAAVSAPP